MVLKCMDAYIEIYLVVSLMIVLEMEGTLKWRGLKLHGPLHSAVSKIGGILLYI